MLHRAFSGNSSNKMAPASLHAMGVTLEYVVHFIYIHAKILQGKRAVNVFEDGDLLE